MAYVWMDGGQVKFRYYVRTVVEASVGISEPRVTSPMVPQPAVFILYQILHLRCSFYKLFCFSQ
jgi:hypothetical protein